MGCTTKDCRNYILQQQRMRTLACDAGDTYMSVHTHYKYAYREFSDVICFDTTYLVNQRHMPFALFVGMNQHKQSILLGWLCSQMRILRHTNLFSRLGWQQWAMYLQQLSSLINVRVSRQQLQGYFQTQSIDTYYFWTGMMSTQRSESMHAFFDDYISERSSLKQFVEQYELALRFKYEKELQVESDSQKTHAAPTSGFD
ncbi:hypothetical protein H5410_014313 [Solanum commersonii]|uniref:Protein FAR1-RELATED SEQUENCE n=1 Tax=Solanum commersonii TaxID=4109 RepID=A0A9J5ZQK8_SOLCO|nr:hypothetical protein H5410_014313 [Solanum commersonii]